MATLYTNENNPAALKILIAANFSKVDINLEIVQVNGKVTFSINMSYVY